MRIDGSCACGTIKIEGEADPADVSICHCTDCQTGTGSAFRVSVLVRGKDFKMTGKPKDYLKLTADSGTPRIQAFCAECGSPIYSTSPGEGVQDAYRVRVGILRQRREFVPKKQNWFRSSRNWVTHMGGIHKNEKQG